MPPHHVCSWLPSPHPLVFGHRGARGLAPENTLAAFDRGVAEGVDGLELDLRLSRDGVPVVIHDNDLARTTDRSGPVSSLNADQLGRLDAAFHFAPDRNFPWRSKGLGVPTLREVLARYPAMPLIVEMKTNSEALALATVREILAAGAAERVCLGSFGFRALSVARRAAPQLATGASQAEVAWALFRSTMRLRLGDARYQAYIVPERRKSLTIISRRFIREASGVGCAVYIWTVDGPEHVERLLGWGARGILTDRPDVTVPVVRSLRQAPLPCKEGCHSSNTDPSGLLSDQPRDNHQQDNH